MRIPRLLIILMTAIVVVVIVVFVVTITRDDEPAPPEPRTPRPDASATEPHPSATATLGPTADLFGNRLDIASSDSGTALVQEPARRADPSQPDYLVRAPAGMAWQRGWGGAALPVSISDGPTTITDGIASGFGRTPQGAGLAAADALGRALAAPDPTWRQVLATRYRGGGQALVDRFARSRARTPEAARYVTVPDGVRIAQGYSPDYAVVEFAIRDGLGYRIARWPMAWADGDWRVAVPTEIETLWGPGTYVDSLTGFGSWRTAA
ncbi:MULTISPECIES: hypothetical protein [Nocardia]|uniref:hypothetical protein n=1 Tax=Nocardia TaxID=1817 RepID=UPI0002D4B35F|nr:MULTISPECIES: hypothetical protein [Nocardia]